MNMYKAIFFFFIYVLFALQYDIHTSFILHFWVVKSFYSHLLKILEQPSLILSSNQLHFTQLHYKQSKCSVFRYICLYTLIVAKLKAKRIMKVWGWGKEVDITLSFKNTEIWNPYELTIWTQLSVKLLKTESDFQSVDDQNRCKYTYVEIILI